jgi:FG-GAP-like repeat/Kre9/KNH-like N-terminal Ig-like domain/Secretion system C-terminal sorting domain
MRITIWIAASFLLPCTAISQLAWDTHYSPDASDAVCIHAVDLDLDGDIDLLTGDNAYREEVIWWENLDGDGLTWEEHLIQEYGRAVSLYPIDIDGDGDLDVLGASSINDRISWFDNVDGDGTNWISQTVSWPYHGASSVFGTDFDGDGDIDVLGAAHDDDEVTWWENIDGDGLTWEEHIIQENLEEPESVHAADIDGDGDMDVLCAASEADVILWWENIDGDGENWIGRSVFGDYPGASSVYAIDMDGDGDIDVLGAAKYGHDISWWENVDGNGLNGVEHIVDGDYYRPTAVFATDVDGDGDVDILASSRRDGFELPGKITWWENMDGTAQELAGHTIYEWYDDVRDVHAADINGDGDTDVVGVVAGNTNVRWWENMGQLAVMSPNGGEVWRINTPQEIEWLSGPDDDVVLELLDGPNVERVIYDGAVNDESVSFTVPDDVEPGDDYRIRITLVSGDVQDISDAPFTISGPPTLTMTTFEPPIIIPPEGDGFFFWIETSNPSPAPVTGQYWTSVVLPDSTTYGPLESTVLTLGAFETIAPAEPFSQWVPDYAPPGVYQFVLSAGIYPDIIVSTDSFEFEKLAGPGSSSMHEFAWDIEDWRREAWKLASAPVADYETQPLPTKYSVSLAHPNPFNASTTISITLPIASELNVVVHNISGQEVAKLANGPFNAGSHTLTFGASNLASGLYFIRATVPGLFDQVQKVMLVR